jgi:hypothetical protein
MTQLERTRALLQGMSYDKVHMELAAEFKLLKKLAVKYLPNENQRLQEVEQRRISSMGLARRMLAGTYL